MKPTTNPTLRRICTSQPAAPMQIPVRALLLTAAATGAYALVLNTMRPKPVPHYTPLAPPSPEVDADRIDAAERDALLQELADQV